MAGPKPDGKPAGVERVVFTQPAAERIARAVRKIEAGNRNGLPLQFRRIAVSQQSPLRLATFTGDWQAGSFATVTLYGSTQTANVYNWCNPALGAGSANTGCVRYVIYGSAGGTNAALEVQQFSTCSTCVKAIGSLDMSLVDGHSESVVQILGHNTHGCLKWFDIASCSTQTADIDYDTSFYM